MFRCLRPRRLLLCYIALFFITVTCLLYNLDNLCPEPRKRSKNEVINIGEKIKQYSELENKFSLLEQTLRRKFPDQVDTIMRMVSPSLPTIYAITPTYARSVQKAELTRLMHTFLHVPNFHWILVEDSGTKTDLVSKFLQKSGLKYTHLNEPTPEEYKLQPKDPHWSKPRGVLQRNKGLDWLRNNVDKGVLYFADDDNTYSLDLFKEMRNTTKVSVWPVGLVGYLRYERPVVRNSRVVGWFTYWKPDRKFAMDMAGFAVNVQLVIDHPDAKFSNYIRQGELESDLISKLGVTLIDLEPKADQCTKVYVWHTRTETPSLKNEDKLRAAGKHRSDPGVEV